MNDIPLFVWFLYFNVIPYAKDILPEENHLYNSSYNWEDKGFHTYPKLFVWKWT